MDARRDTCTLFVGLVRAAAGKSPKAIAAANTYINNTVLGNCTVYANGGHVKRHVKPRS